MEDSNHPEVEPADTVTGINMGGCVESSPSVRDNYAYVGVTIDDAPDLQRVTIVDPATGGLACSGFWELGQESRGTPSLAYDYAYSGVDTGHIFYRVHDPATDPPMGLLPQYAVPVELYPYPFFVGSAAHTTGGVVYVGNDNGRFYALDADDLGPLFAQPGDDDGYYDGGIQNSGFICSSPAIGYRVDEDNNRWVFITTRSDGGKLYAFKISR